MIKQESKNIHTSINLNSNFIHNGLVMSPTHDLHIANKYYVDAATIIKDVPSNTSFMTFGGIIANETIIENKGVVDIITNMLYPKGDSEYLEPTIKYYDNQGNEVDYYNMLVYTETQIEINCKIDSHDRELPLSMIIETVNTDSVISREFIINPNGECNLVLDSVNLLFEDSYIRLKLNVAGIDTPKKNLWNEDIPIPYKFTQSQTILYPVPFKRIRPIFYEIANTSKTKNDLYLLPVTYESLSDYSIAGNINEYKFNNDTITYPITIFNDNPKTITIFIPHSIIEPHSLIYKGGNEINLLNLLGIKEKDFTIAIIDTNIESYIGYQIQLGTYKVTNPIEINAIYRNSYKLDDMLGSFDSNAFDASYL